MQESKSCALPLGDSPLEIRGWVVGLEPTISGTTIRRANQLHHTHHILSSPSAGPNDRLGYGTDPLTKFDLHTYVYVSTSLGGFEPSTYGLEGRCSIQLSYRLIILKTIYGFKKAGDGNRTHVSSLEG